jgi:hypothetical protein
MHLSMPLHEEKIRDTDVAGRLPATTGWQPVLPGWLGVDVRRDSTELKIAPRFNAGFDEEKRNRVPQGRKKYSSHC